MKDLICDEFQEAVGKYLLRHRSILDVLSKIQEAGARTNRAVVKSVTACGCLEIQAQRQRVPADTGLEEALRFLSTHLQGRLCADCREQVEEEIGNLLFYLAALCNLLDINLYDVLLKEQERLLALGPFHLS
ncbi:MAG TPA: DUF1573 domain-containing protein [Firmicutes bacterium]|jgi:hypothetical protein|nr:hypothetical protein [Bacillota bacterium]MDK2927568.1 hypothetical protein [Bacillota bacterium]HHV57974.1 DUF1573 domain-containing protein [Bacillota bacterium]